MYYIDPHIHMISRVTDDYHRMAQCGCAAVSEPAFWAGFDRGSAEGFRDYFHHLVRAMPRGTRHQGDLPGEINFHGDTPQFQKDRFLNTIA
jgi:predicted metal-dependent TIM-barrel fold hydrolase